jgi:hypothetical protein
LKSKLNDISDDTKKSQLENKISNLESQINNLDSQNNTPSQSIIFKNLEEEIKKIRKKLKGDEPGDDEPDDDDPQPGPSDKKRKKFIFYGDSREKSGYVKFGGEGDNFLLFLINKNHPRIKKLLSEGKLQDGKQFTICYGKVDKISERGGNYTFNENNQELEIIESKSPSPSPNPNPQNNKVISYVATKVNDNTYKYHFLTGDESGEELTFKYVIDFLG